jgi:hypothetical protein
VVFFANGQTHEGASKGIKVGARARCGDWQGKGTLWEWSTFVAAILGAHCIGLRRPGCRCPCPADPVEPTFPSAALLFCPSACPQCGCSIQQRKAMARQNSHVTLGLSFKASIPQILFLHVHLCIRAAVCLVRVHPRT